MTEYFERMQSKAVLSLDSRHEVREWYSLTMDRILLAYCAQSELKIASPGTLSPEVHQKCNGTNLSGD